MGSLAMFVLVHMLQEHNAKLEALQKELDSSYQALNDMQVGFLCRNAANVLKLTWCKD